MSTRERWDTEIRSPFLNEVQGFSFESPSGAVPEGRLASLESPFLNEFSFEAFTREPQLVDEWSFEGEQPGEASALAVLSPSELKAVRITSTFETGRAGSFGGLTGNDDGQGISFGLMNFAWKAGSLLTLLMQFLRDHPADFAQAFGPDAARFREIVLATTPDPKNPKRRIRDLERQMEFARSINDAKNHIRKPWSDSFARLEVNPHFRGIQVNAVRAAMEKARHWCKYFGLGSERAFAFMFDLVSSHGGAWLNAPKFKGQRRTLLRKMLEEKKARVGRAELHEREKLEVIANMIADVSSDRYRERVRIRKMWFVNGKGKVHGTLWDITKDFGITDRPPVFDREEPEQEALSYLDETEDLAQGQGDDESEEETEEFFVRESVSESAMESAIEPAAEWEMEEEEADPETESYAFSSHADEAEEEDFGAPEFDLDHTFLDEEGEESESEWESDAPYEVPQAVVYDARIVNNKARTERTPAEIALMVGRWGAAEKGKVSGVRLRLYECDVREAGRSDAAAAKDVQMGEFTFDLVPNPELVKSPGKAGIPHTAIANAKWANAALEKSYKATAKADVTLWLGSKAFPLWVPRVDILEEGNAVEIGFTLEDGTGNTLNRTSIPQGHVVSVAIPDYLAVMLAIPGRFDDPKRDPAIDKDGTRFSEFLRGRDRRAFVAKWLDDHAALRDAASEPNADLKTSDIVKAWFIIHDVGVSASLTDRRYRANQPATKNGAVHGFLNRGGYYAATHDFTKNRQGTVYEFMSKKALKHVNGRTINIETVPDIEPDVSDRSDGSRGLPSNAAQYASIGYRRKGKKVTYYKWTKAAFDVLADLYIFASARAGHLLTITAHKEVDRNLGRSVLWREYTAAEMRAGTGKHWDTARYTPSNYHGDPYGFDMQALYDIITRKLNALGGRQMPAGARYGIHPRRVCKTDGEDIVNGSNHLHQFPHQSSPTISTDTGMKKPGWWNA